MASPYPDTAYQVHEEAEGEVVPAAGWITAMEMRDGVIWAKVDWTGRAAVMIAAREYRFISPEFLVDKQKMDTTW